MKKLYLISLLLVIVALGGCTRSSGTDSREVTMNEEGETLGVVGAEDGFMPGEDESFYDPDNLEDPMIDDELLMEQEAEGFFDEGVLGGEEGILFDDPLNDPRLIDGGDELLIGEVSPSEEELLLGDEYSL